MNKDSIAESKKTIEISPGYGEAYYSLAVTYYYEGECGLWEERMKEKRILILALTFLLLLSVPGFALDHLYPAKVERVVDGDTIIVTLSLGLDVVLKNQWIRFYGINAWEPKGEQREKGLEATKYLEERLSSGEIEIEIRPEWGQAGKGSFGRWLGVIYVDGVNVNVELMEKGHAEEYEEGGN